MKAYRHLVQYALNEGHKVSVWDGEAWSVKFGTNLQKIIDAIEGVEEAQLRITDAQTKDAVAWAYVLPFGLEDDETLVNFSDNEFMQTWSEIYYNR